MKAYSKVTAVGAALLLVGALAGTALAIEAFSERFEEDFSQPRTILARVIVVDPYEDAVWVNWVWKGVRNSGEINQFWAMMLPRKNMGAPVPVDVLGEDIPGGSLKYGEHVTFKNLPPGCVGEAPTADAPKKP